VAKKRGNGEGGITRHKKSGLYMARYTVQTVAGPKRKTLYGKTRGEVSEKLTKAMASRDGGLVFDADNLKVEEYMARWLADSVRDTVRRSTFARYEQNTRLHIVPALGRTKLKNLTPAHVRGLYREKLDSGLSARSVQYVHATLHKALKQAVADGLIPRNVTEAVKAPRPVKKEIQPLNAKQARTLLDTARGDRLEAIYVVAVTSGMREGELLGLKWEDLDLDAGKLAVRRSLSMTKDGPAYELPKNGKGRSIKLPARAVEALKRHKAAQNVERLGLGTLWQDHDLIFPGHGGQPMRAWSLTGGPFLRLLKRAGLPEKTRFHDLRHTCATLLLSRSVHPKIVQELLGHATISITLDTYSHVLPGMGDRAANVMDETL
jgi:integrase